MLLALIRLVKAGVQPLHVTLSEAKGPRKDSEILCGACPEHHRFFSFTSFRASAHTLRMTGSEGLRMTTRRKITMSKIIRSLLLYFGLLMAKTVGVAIKVTIAKISQAKR